MNVRIFWVSAMKCMCAQTRPRFILSTESIFWGMELIEPMLTPREKIPSTGKFPQRRIEPATLWTVSPNTTDELFRPPYRGLCMMPLLVIMFTEDLYRHCLLQMNKKDTSNWKTHISAHMYALKDTHTSTHPSPHTHTLCIYTYTGKPNIFLLIRCFSVLLHYWNGILFLCKLVSTLSFL